MKLGDDCTTNQSNHHQPSPKVKTGCWWLLIVTHVSHLASDLTFLSRPKGAGAWSWDDSVTLMTAMAAWYHVSIILDQFVSSLYGFSTAFDACLYTLHQLYQLRSVKIPNGAIWRRLRRQGTWNHRGTERCCRHLGMRLSWTESTFHHIRHDPFIADVCSATRSTWGSFPPKKELLGPKSPGNRRQSAQDDRTPMESSLKRIGQHADRMNQLHSKIELTFVYLVAKTPKHYH